MSIKIKSKVFLLCTFVIFCTYKGFITYIVSFDLQSLIILLITIIGIYKLFFSKDIRLTHKVLFIILVTYVLLSAFAHFNQIYLKKGINQYILFSMTYFAFSAYINFHSMEIIVKMMPILGVINTFLGVIENITNHYFLPNSKHQIDGGHLRVAALSGNFIIFPMLLAFSIIASLYLYKIYRDKKQIIFIVWNLFGILISQSRGPLVALFCGIVLYYLADATIKGNVLLIRRIFFLSTIVLIAYCLIFESSILDSTFFGSYLNRIRSILVWSEEESSNYVRNYVWSLWIEKIKQNPWLGIVGPGSTGSDMDVTLGVTESAIIKHLAEIGIIGSIIYYLFFCSLIHTGINKIKNCNYKDRMLRLACISFICIVFVESITLQIDEYYSVIAMMWVSFAYLTSRADKEKVSC